MFEKEKTAFALMRLRWGMLRHSRSGKISAEGIGLALCVLGGLMAVAALLLQYIQTYYPFGWSWMYTLVLGIVGLLVLVLGAIVNHAE